MLYTLKQTAEKLGISPYELRMGALQGRYPFLNCGRKRLFDPEKEQAAIDERMIANQREAAKR